MKWNTFYYILFTIVTCNCEVVSHTLKTETDFLLVDPNDTHICTEMKFYCESCTNLVMCVDSEYGFLKQYVTCPAGSSCLVDKCTEERNPLCDGTADIPFKCHVTGVFPDPFDCQKYHFCVPQSNSISNSTLNLKHYEHKCPDDGDKKYRYDPRTNYCRYELIQGCQHFPVPLCNYEGESGLIKENHSIFYVCDLVDNHLYPHMYICPHGYVYSPEEVKCLIGFPKHYLI